MNRIPKRYTALSLVLLTIGLVLGCQRDDICSESTILTPLLTIIFVDNDPNNLNEPQRVNDLQITSLDKSTNQEFFQTVQNTDSIQIPLRTFADTSTFVFTRNFGNENTDLIQNDTIQFSYTRNDTFINRACGFRTTYSNLEFNFINTPVWIQNTTILNNEINEQENTHIRIAF